MAAVMAATGAAMTPDSSSPPPKAMAMVMPMPISRVRRASSDDFFWAAASVATRPRRP
jgi:hypothetical protein